MILTGSEIIKQVDAGEIVIDPFDLDAVNPNSVNLTLGPRLKVYELAPLDNLTRQHTLLDDKGEAKTIPVPTFLNPEQPHPVIFDLTMTQQEGLLLVPGKLYIGHTMEFTGSERFVPRIDGRSSFGRLGLMVHLTAGFGDLGYKGQWTLELSCIHPILVRPGMPLCQISFYEVKGDRTILYRGKYLNAKGPVEARYHEEAKQVAAKGAESVTQTLNKEPVQ